MTAEQFNDGFLRIASRLKDDGERRSAIYGRRFTGAKGIGRLAAHKLARLLKITSVPRRATQNIVDATIDWEAVERYQTLDELEGTNAVSLTERVRAGRIAQGTTISLEKLRERWTPTSRLRFQYEVASFQPPPVVTTFEQKKLAGTSILGELTARDISSADDKVNAAKFDCRLEGDLAEEEDYWDVVADVADWVVEVDAQPLRIKYAVIPTKRNHDELNDQGANPRSCRVHGPHPAAATGPFFKARVLVREGEAHLEKRRKAWLGRMSNVWVFMEGFRVLPYGEPSDDWLNIDTAYSKRERSLDFLSDLVGVPSADADEGLQHSRKDHYFGCVFLTQEQSPGLQMLVNREGFLPNDSFEALRQIMQTAVNLSVRHRAAVRAPLRAQRGKERQQSRSAETERTRLELRAAVEEAAQRASVLAHEARSAAAAGDYRRATELIARAADEFRAGGEVHDRLITERQTMQVLASLGLQMTALVHEVRGLLGMLRTLDEALSIFRKEAQLDAKSRGRLAAIHVNVGEARRIVERQAAYLTDVTAPDARRRRSKQKLAERFDAAVRLFDTQIAHRNIELENAIPADLKTPPMFPAEVMLVFTNLLSNAVKAAGENGRIIAKGELTTNGGVVFRLENTGAKVNLADAERWFLPFETTTADLDPKLGQGIGMGLPITRNLLEEYGAKVRFVAPTKGLSTAVEVVFLA